MRGVAAGLRDSGRLRRSAEGVNMSKGRTPNQDDPSPLPPQRATWLVELPFLSMNAPRVGPYTKEVAPFVCTAARGF